MMLKKKQILNLRPEFKFGYQNMVDWFEITEGSDYIIIKSGLRHADGETKSPYHYTEFTMGKNYVKNALIKFNNWWDQMNVNNEHIK